MMMILPLRITIVTPHLLTKKKLGGGGWEITRKKIF